MSTRQRLLGLVLTITLAGASTLAASRQVLFQLTLPTNGAGQLSLAWSSWPGGLSGASLYFQVAVADAGAPCGAALSNALRADVP